MSKGRSYDESLPSGIVQVKIMRKNNGFQQTEFDVNDVYELKMWDEYQCHS